ncbi:MAG: pyrrolidone-carboxylate peptidase [Alteromonadaceae bacterium]|jgi:pyrrolidone-carboxylate peptidase
MQEPIHKRTQKQLFALLAILVSHTAHSSELTVEELRIDKATQVMPKVMQVFDRQLTAFTEAFETSAGFEQSRDVVITQGEQLWRDAKQQIRLTNSFDDRPLFWARLKYSKTLRTVKPGYEVSPTELDSLLGLLEQSSRGRTELSYPATADKRLLLTGFDPFLLDRHIDQSNPSGVAAMLLDGKVIEHNGITAQINAVMVPVRYADFDQGIIERLLAPFYALNSVDLIATISMGRTEFDLEHFPGKRRSAAAPDNLNVFSGGTNEAPLISLLNGAPLPGPEFVQFSLPYATMQQAKGGYKINDNRRVVTLQKPMTASSLHALAQSIAVSGSGGGYLSNEISYRSIRLKNQLNSSIPTGHIHTPRIAQFDPKTVAAIVTQIEAMLRQALSALD